MVLERFFTKFILYLIFFLYVHSLGFYFVSQNSPWLCNTAILRSKGSLYDVCVYLIYCLTSYSCSRIATITGPLKRFFIFLTTFRNFSFYSQIISSNIYSLLLSQLYPAGNKISRLMTYIYIYIYMSYRTANLQTLHFIYLFNKYTYWIF